MARVRRSSLSPVPLGAALAALVAALLLVPLGSASAHDQLTGSEPADGETVEQAPEELVLTFSGEIAQVGAQVRVTGPDGETVSDGDPQVEGTELTQALQADRPAGAYEVTWRVTSQDGHPISGTFGFEATEAAEAGGGEETTTAEETTADESTAAEETTPAAPTTEADGDDAGITAGPDAGDEPAGLPVWAWVLVGIAALGLLGLLARTWTRGRE